MISLVIFYTILRTSFSEVPSELQTSCQPYIDACNSQTRVDNTALHSPCSEVFAAATCPGRTKANYWECISQEFDTNRQKLTLEAEYLEACFYEESKALETYSIYKSDYVNGTIQRNIVPDLATGAGLEDLKLTTFTFQTGDLMAPGGFYNIDINVNFGSLDVQPGYQVGIMDSRTVPHINLHACKMTDQQRTCSSKFYQSSDAGASTVQSFDDFDGNPGLHSEELQIMENGTWRIMGHIYYFIGGPCSESTPNCEQTRWDISMVKEIEVMNNIPAELQDACQPYIRRCRLETKFSGLDESKLACNEHFDASACPGRTKANYWECISPTLDAARKNITLTTEYLEACFYEESKALETYSFYKSDLSEGFYTKKLAPHSGEPSVTELQLTTFNFKSGCSIAPGTAYLIDIDVQYGNLDVAKAKEQGVFEFRDIPHINLHACEMTNNQKTCSSKFYASADATTVAVQSANEYTGEPGLHEEQLILPSEGIWRIMGHIYYYIGECETTENCEQTRWDISMTKEIRVSSDDTTCPGEEIEDDSGSLSLLCIFSLLMAFWQF